MSEAVLISMNAILALILVLTFIFVKIQLEVIYVTVKLDTLAMEINAKMLTSVEVISKVTWSTVMSMLSVLILLVLFDVNVKMDIPVMVQHV